MTAESSRPALAALSRTDLSAAFGAVVWLGATALVPLSTIDRALTLAPLVLVPLGIGMVSTPPFTGRAGRFYRVATAIQPVGALGVLASVSLPSTPLAAALAVPWLGVTGLLGLAALDRIHRRGLTPLAETVCDAGLGYLNVAAVALLLYQLELTFWFDPVIVLLTVVHFHYAGFVLPVVTGLTGRCVSGGRLFTALTTVVLVGPALIAVGISFSPLVEVVAVGGFTTAVAALGGYVAVRVAPTRDPLQRVALTVSALALPVSMVLALGYGVGAYFGSVRFGVDLTTMVRLHGTLNAFGFGLLATVGWWLSVPPAATS